MKKQTNKTQTGTNVEEVQKQNAAGQYGAEFASETNAAEVKRQNQQSESKKNQPANNKQSR
ncbi:MULTISPECIES: gamma-type small acid-soluble spore protein [Jeotgalibacillus]|uniref:gamma-type small acid-soluble spore protein n=1 Tax=Jeotgalibacillus TaxID=157226 RepID=UPI00106D1BC7|nr:MULTISPECIES: gamma-type small acid-soluble spore protein [Jeotgalibacillus]TFE01247.1 gamma-type small acid-soluble spore protein [Jeotgalibacillus sp. R-1-5s-1]